MDNFLEDLHNPKKNIVTPEIMELLYNLPIKEEEETFLSDFRKEVENGKAISIFKRISQLCNLFEDMKKIAAKEAIQEAKPYENSQLEADYGLVKSQKTTYYYTNSDEHQILADKMKDLEAKMKLAHKAKLKGQDYIDEETGEVVLPAITKFSKPFLRKA